MIFNKKEEAYLSRNLPMFSDRPPCVALKLEWKPRHPRTPPPKSVKLYGSSWKNDCRTRRQPLKNHIKLDKIILRLSHEN